MRATSSAGCERVARHFLVRVLIALALVAFGVGLLLPFLVPSVPYAKQYDPSPLSLGIRP